MSFKAYPLIFQPILKERIWGGNKLNTVLGKELPFKNTGESWELSAVKGDISVVKNGFFSGKSLQELIDLYPSEILGTTVFNRFGNQFPLLFKFIDAREDLSIQVHPNDELAAKRHDSFGKTEMWYVMQADPNSRIIAGFKKDSNQEEFLKSVENKTVIDLLDAVEAKQGQCFFLETGTVHAIGAGVMIAEIQQTSDITYRIYDFDRVDANGNKRDLHLDNALDAINYHKSSIQVDYSNLPNKANSLVNCTYFTANFISLTKSYVPDIAVGSFSVYLCTEGSFTIKCEDNDYSFEKGDTVLIPSALIVKEIIGNADLLEIYIA